MPEDHSEELAMRAEPALRPKTEEELVDYINATVSRGEQGYGESAAATGMIAAAAFNYAASKLGITGYQASFASMDVYRRTTSTKGPFMVVKAEKALYPQYDLLDDIRQFLSECNDWLTEEARKKLTEEEARKKLEGGVGAHPAVVEHWQKLAQHEENADGARN